MPGRYQITVDSEGMSPSPSRDVALLARDQIYVKIGIRARLKTFGNTRRVVLIRHLPPGSKA
jgi:hypothetical protein